MPLDKLKSITIKDINLYTIAIPYIEPLRTSFGSEPDKVAIVIEVITEECVTGWGEASIEIEPGYGSETVVTGEHILTQFIIPRLIGKTIAKATDFPELLRLVRGNHHTKAGVEAAIWDALAKVNDMRLADYFALFMPDGHVSEDKTTVGVSIGIQSSVEKTLEIIDKRVAQGYQRVKLKIARGWDVELAMGVREKYPDVMLMLDANSDYRLKDADHLKQLDEFDLLMIEQPLAYYDIYEHGLLQKQMNTPVCLDESIKSTNDLLIAIQVGAIRILNLKPSRVGGFSECVKIYRTCIEHELPLWIGGMLETGIGRAANVAFASLPGVNMPSDISATDRYFKEDIATPNFVLNSDDSTLSVPNGIGIGVEIQRDRLEQASKYWREQNPYS
jgi:o-succinylbenzoate synthase